MKKKRLKCRHTFFSQWGEMLFKFPVYQETLGKCVGPTVNSEGRSTNLGVS